ncbi:hypothetical protein FQZ97_938840 [compost metagenome]
MNCYLEDLLQYLFCHVTILYLPNHFHFDKRCSCYQLQNQNHQVQILERPKVQGFPELLVDSCSKALKIEPQEFFLASSSCIFLIKNFSTALESS